MDWQEFIFNPKEDWIGRLEKRSRRRFSDENTADEALNYALKKLGENNWERLNSFQGRSKPGTFLYTILNNQLEDFSRKRFGYPRPPVWVERLGVHWKTIWKRLCLEREAEQALLVIYQENEAQTREIIKTIKAKITGCGKASSITSIGGTLAEENYDLDEQLEKHAQSECKAVGNMETQTESNQSNQLLAALCHALNIETDNIDINNLSNQIEQQSSQFKDLFQLSSEQLLLLKLKYQQGYKIAAMAKILKLKEHTARRNLQSAEKHILLVLQQSNLEIGDFLAK
ncbi:MAG: ECF-type sigma factor [Pseudomonadota bacterium]